MTNHQDSAKLFAAHAALCRQVNKAEMALDSLELAQVSGIDVDLAAIEYAEADVNRVSSARDSLDEAVLQAPINIPGDIDVKANVAIRLAMWDPKEGADLFRRLADQVAEFARSDRAVPLEWEDDREETLALA